MDPDAPNTYPPVHLCPKAHPNAVGEKPFRFNTQKFRLTRVLRQEERGFKERSLREGIQSYYLQKLDELEKA